MSTSRIVHFWRMKGVPILKQLQLEESLLRANKTNWCLINTDVQQPAAVLGISTKLKDVLHLDRAAQLGLQVIRRFSGGGTVVIDRNTILVTLIFDKSLIPNLSSYPRPIMNWTEKFYSPVFSPYGDFKLKDTDYVFGDLKFGGNAQSIVKNRWLHHTSFLWDIDPVLMSTLKHPPKQPEYRKNRSHEDFLCSLQSRFRSKETFIDSIQEALHFQGFELKVHKDSATDDFLNGIHMRTTTLIPSTTK